ncbi:MAG: phasin family protein [Motiliproteus sp.]|nr:phasin family protein [Motiliproteus sp.]MCW9054148.1 phasin family protein [Motiliproteus sp.]
MYDNIISEMKERMQPVVVLAESNQKMIEKLATIQTESMTAMINASVEQMKELSSCTTPKAFLESQTTYYKTLGSKMTETTESSIAVMTEAKEEMVPVVEDIAKKASDSVEEIVKQVPTLN